MSKENPILGAELLDSSAPELVVVTEECPLTDYAGKSASDIITALEKRSDFSKIANILVKNVTFGEETDNEDLQIRGEEMKDIIESMVIMEIGYCHAGLR